MATKTVKSISINLLLVLLVGCETTQFSWQTIDGEAVSEEKLAVVKEACEYDKKLAEINQAEKDERLLSSLPEISKKELGQEVSRRRILELKREIDNCMNANGLALLPINTTK